MRTPQPQYVVHRSPRPNGKNHWYIVGRPGGRRVRAWFATEAEASKEADLRNQEMGKGSPLSAKNGGKLSNADILSPSTVTEAAVIKMGNTPTDDELLELIETMGSPMETAREILNLRAENSRLQQENSRLRNDHGSDAEIFAMLTADHPSERYEDQINW